jgi:nucleoside-diphosphate-sugar epimerase
VKILVTGGAGYLGSILVERLLANDHEVTVLDNLMYRQESLIPFCHNDKFHFVRVDVRDQLLLVDCVSRSDCIIPLAAIVGAPACDDNKQLATLVNYCHVQRVCNAARKDQLVIYPNTNSGYGSHGGVCTEETLMSPISHYGLTKCDAEKVVLENGGISLRLATLFGVSYRMRLDLLVNDFVHRALRDGCIVLYEKDFKRNFLHVRDAAECFCFMIRHHECEGFRGQAFNVGLSDANLSKLELAKRIHLTLGQRVDIFCSDASSDPDKRDYIVSNEKIEKAGWRPRYSLADGILELEKAYPLFKSQYANL